MYTMQKNHEAHCARNHQLERPIDYEMWGSQRTSIARRVTADEQPFRLWIEHRCGASVPRKLVDGLALCCGGDRC